MNERLRELAEESGMTQYVAANNKYLERFAEMIVKECARTSAHFSIQNKRIHPDIDPRDMPEANRMVYHSTCQSVAEEIRDHFGIE